MSKEPSTGPGKKLGLGHGCHPMRLYLPVFTAVTEPPPEPYLVGNPPQALSSCRGEEDSSWSPQILLYSSTQELQTLAALKLRVAMLDQQIHLEKVLPKQEVGQCIQTPGTGAS